MSRKLFCMAMKGFFFEQKVSYFVMQLYKLIMCMHMHNIIANNYPSFL